MSIWPRPFNFFAVLLLFSLLLFCFPSLGTAATTNIPSFYTFHAGLSQPPELQRPLTLTATLEPLLGSLTDIEVSVDLPEGWPTLEPQRLSNLASGSRHEFCWQLVPSRIAVNGSILVRLSLATPKDAIIAACRVRFPVEAASMADAINKWPATTSTMAQVAFTLTEHEGFYPLRGDAWVHYDRRLRPSGAEQGVVYGHDPLVSVSQAQTDVDMFDKLQGLLLSDPNLAEKLAASGIDLQKKKQDQLYGLYVLGTEQYEKGQFDTALQILERLRSEFPPQPSQPMIDLGIATGNLSALSHWARGDQRAARKAFQNTFYGNRKHPLQRYILRNLALLMLDTGDKTAAREMLRLALQAKSTYTLAAREFEGLRTP